jgi:hypothetical protein
MSEVPLISIVDDDALARDGIRELVESLGYKAIAFVSAQHFLASRVLAETTCLITDVQMPELNGLELQSRTGVGWGSELENKLLVPDGRPQICLDVRCLWRALSVRSKTEISNLTFLSEIIGARV